MKKFWVDLVDQICEMDWSEWVIWGIVTCAGVITVAAAWKQAHLGY